MITGESRWSLCDCHSDSNPSRGQSPVLGVAVAAAVIGVIGMATLGAIFYWVRLTKNKDSLLPQRANGGRWNPWSKWTDRTADNISQGQRTRSRSKDKTTCIIYKHIQAYICAQSNTTRASLLHRHSPFRSCGLNEITVYMVVLMKCMSYSSVIRSLGN